MNDRKPLSAIILFLFVAAVYLSTSSPGIGFDDSAELAAGARLLAMVHATGYPLYLLVGRLMAWIIPDAGRALVILSSLAGAGTVFVLFLDFRERYRPAAAVAAALAFAVSWEVWTAATRVEVYTLHLLFLSIILYLLPRACAGTGTVRIRLLGLVSGLAVGHHMGTGILLPVFALAIGMKRGRDALHAVPYFALGASVYAVLPLLSARPEIATIQWRPIRTATELIDVVTGKNFREWLFVYSPGEVLANISVECAFITANFPFIGAILAAVGIPVLSKRDTLRFGVLGAVSIIIVLHTANYGVLDKDVFLLPVFIPMAEFIAAGASWIEEKLPRRGVSIAILVLTPVVSILTTAALWGLPIRTGRTLPHDYAEAVLGARDEGDLIWANWRYFPPLQYLRLVEGRGEEVHLEVVPQDTGVGTGFVPGATFVTTPNLERGETWALTMTGLAWRLDPREADTVPLSAASPGAQPPILTIGGISVLSAETEARARRLEAIGCTVILALDTPPGETGRADTIALSLDLVSPDGAIALSTPARPHRWFLPPSEWHEDEAYIERIETFVTGSRPPGNYRYRLTATTLTSRRSMDLGIVAVAE